jgi:hypothetical protein
VRTSGTKGTEATAGMLATAGTQSTAGTQTTAIRYPTTVKPTAAEMPDTNTSWVFAKNSSKRTDKKENQIFLINKEIQRGAVAKSYEEGLPNIWGNAQIFFNIQYEEAVSHIWICNCSILNFLVYEENFIFFFISAAKIREKLVKEQINGSESETRILGSKPE